VTSSQNARNAMPAGYRNPELDDAIREVSGTIHSLQTQYYYFLKEKLTSCSLYFR
jgi:hypothetical protein